MGFLGQQYVLPQEKYEQPQSAAMQGPVRAQQAYGEGLLGLEEDVEGYYRDYNAVNQFAHGMWKNYQIDVTAPDPSNPASVQAYNMYLQGMSQVQERGNRMKNRQDLFKSGYLESLKSADVRFAAGMEEGKFDPTQDIANIGMTGATKEILKRFNVSVKSEEEEAQLNQMKGEAIQVLQEELQTVVGDEARTREIQAQINALEQAAVSYDPTYDKLLKNNRAIAAIRKKATGKDIYTSARWKGIANAQGGNMGIFTSMTKGGKPIFEDATYVPAKGQILLRPAGLADPIVISLKSADGGAKAIHNILNEYASTTDEEVDWNEVLGFGSQYKTELGNNILQPMKDYNIKGLNEFHKNLTDATRRKQKGSIAALNSVAAREGLLMPDLEGLSQVVITDVDWGSKSALNWSNRLKLSYIDEEGEPQTKQLDPTNSKDSAFIDEFLKINSGIIDFTQFAPKKVAAKQTPTQNVTYMLDGNGNRRAVPNDQVKDAEAAGYTIANKGGKTTMVNAKGVEREVPNDKVSAAQNAGWNIK